MADNANRKAEPADEQIQPVEREGTRGKEGSSLFDEEAEELRVQNDEEEHRQHGGAGQDWRNAMQ